jgi:hypothetical protein
MDRRLLSIAFSLAALAAGMVQVPSGRLVSDPQPERVTLPRPVFVGPVNPTVIPDPIPIIDPVVEVLPEPKQEPQQEPSVEIKPEPEPQPKVETKPQPKLYHDPVTGLDVPESTIIMVSMRSCGPCQKWWAERSQPLKQAGWTVIKHEGAAAGVRSFPTFRVTIRGKWHTHAGPLSYLQLRRLSQHSFSKPIIAEGKTWGVTKQSDVPNRSWTINGRAWTLETLRRHMYESEHHRYPAGSLDHIESLDELDRLHTADHESQG